MKIGPTTFRDPEELTSLVRRMQIWLMSAYDVIHEFTIEGLSSTENYPKELCARHFTVLKRTQEKPFVEVFIVKRLTNFQEGENGTKILFQTRQ